MFIILWLINFLACLWFLLSDMQQNIEENWFLQYNSAIDKNYHSITRWEQMVQSWYASLLIINGEGVEPITPAQHLWCAIISLIGMAIQASVISELAHLVSKLSASQTEYDIKRENMDYQMSHLRLPKSLQDRIREYYSFLWKEHRCIDGNPLPFMHELSPPIRLEVDLYMKRKLINGSSLFLSAPAEFVRDLASRLSMVFYLSGDFVVREGDPGFSMYFISRGELHVTIKKSFIKALVPGECFGEIAVIRVDNKRSASVHAFKNSSLYELTRVGVEKLTEDHPHALREAIAQHFKHISPGGKRQALVFARRGSVQMFQEGLREEASPTANRASESGKAVPANGTEEEEKHRRASHYADC